MEATLSQILDAREQRVARQQQLLERFQQPLVCFTMNIAGPEKDSALIRQGFSLGKALLLAQLKGSGLTILHSEERFDITGPVGFYTVDADALQLKALTCQVEDSSPEARLFDMDVLTPGGRKIGRDALGLSPRKCLICQADARICGRSRAHSVEQLQAQTRLLLEKAIQAHTARQIAAAAVQSLLWEVCTTPKPGLVDCGNSGSHHDMDIFTFTASAAALHPYFEDCVSIGIATATLPPEETFRRLRLPGKAAEQAMYRATGGVNTHKGAIFSLGLLCAAVGRTGSRQGQILLAECAAMTRGITGSELGAGICRTSGEQLYAKYGLRGVRGQAEDGFPAVSAGLAVFERGLTEGLSLNDAGCAALLHILVRAGDTNLYARGGADTCQEILSALERLLEMAPYPKREVLEALDREFTAKNLSPGGSADLLAMVYFLHLLGQNQ